jgi:hypothetical protein
MRASNVADKLEIAITQNDLPTIKITLQKCKLSQKIFNIAWLKSIYCGYLDIAKYLATQMKYVPFNYTALEQSVRSGCLEVFQYVFENKSDWNTESVSNCFALCGKLGHLDIIKYILAPERILPMRWNESHCCYCACEHAIVNGHIEVLAWLIEHNQSSGILAYYDVIYEAMSRGYVEMAKYVIDSGYNFTNKIGFRWCLENDQLAIVKYLICEQYGNRNVNLVFSDTFTDIFLSSVMYNRTEIMSLLVDLDFDLRPGSFNMIVDWYMTCLEVNNDVCYRGFTNMLSLLPKRDIYKFPSECTRRLYSFNYMKFRKPAELFSKRILLRINARKNNFLKRTLKPTSLFVQMFFI